MCIKTVVYLDVLLLVNFVIAVFLLLSAGVLCGRNCKNVFLMISALFASLTTLILFAPELPFVLQCCYKAGSAFVSVKLCYPSVRLRELLRLCLWYLCLNLLLAGVVTAALLSKQTDMMQTNNLMVYVYISPTLLIACVGFVYILLKVVLYCFDAPMQSQVCDVCISFEGEILQCNMFLDTGFHVEDVFSSRKVILLCTEMVDKKLPIIVVCALEEARNVLSGAEGARNATMPIRFLSCETVAGITLLPAVAASAIWNVKTPQKKETNILVAFCEKGIFTQGCEGLFGENLMPVLGEKELV